LKHNKHSLHSSLQSTSTGVDCQDSVVHFSDMKTAPVTTSECAPYVCTADVFQCPDGSYVSRNNRNYCDFYPCPATRTLEQCNFNTSLPSESPSIEQATEGNVIVGAMFETSMLYPSSGTSQYNPELQILTQESEEYTSLLMNDFSLYAAEDSCTWLGIQPDADTWDFSECNKASDLASCQGKKFKLGPLISVYTLPDWLDNADDEQTAKSRLNNYIETVVSTYYDADYIDVVEDAIYSTDTVIKYRSSDKLWYSELEYSAHDVPDYILQAFYKAKVTSANAKLGYSEYGVMNNTLKFQFMVNMIQGMKDQIDPIVPDYVSLKDQLYVGWTELYRTFIGINQLGTMGVSTHLAPHGIVVHVNDVSSTTHLITTSFSKNMQGYLYATLLKACMVNPHCEVFQIDTPFDRRNLFIDHAIGIFDADYNDKVAVTAIKTTLSGSYLWIDGFMDQVAVITADYFDTIAGTTRPLMECTEANICDSRGCHNGQCNVKYFEVNPALCHDATALSMVTEAACDVPGGLGAKNWFNSASLRRPKKHRGFGRPWSPLLKLSKGRKRLKSQQLHCSLDVYEGNGEHVMVEIEVAHGNYSSIGPNAFTASCNNVDAIEATAAITDATLQVVEDWGYTERDKYVIAVDLEALPAACKEQSGDISKYFFQLDRTGCNNVIDAQSKRYEVSISTALESHAKLGVTNTPNIDMIVTPYSGGTPEETECTVINADKLEYKYSASIVVEGLSPNLRWSYLDESSDATSSFICSSPPCLFTGNETINVMSKNIFIEGSVASAEEYTVQLWTIPDNGDDPQQVSVETIAKSVVVNCVSGSSQVIDIVNVHTEATSAVFFMDDKDVYQECEGDECDSLDRDDTIALSLTLNQPSMESGLIIENIHWSLVEGLPNGDTVTVEDIMYQDSLIHGNKCEKDIICEGCTWKDILYSPRVDIWEGITIETFISELMSHNPNFYATVVTINFDIEATIGYCRNDARRRLLSIYHLSHAESHDNVIKRSASIGIRLGSEADAENPVSDSGGGAIFSSRQHSTGDLVSLTVSGGTNVLVMGMAILFLMSLCFLYALCQKGRKGKGFVHQDRSVVRTWR
jgi:GH35 family endo-1,4-beta-xylanase